MEMTAEQNLEKLNQVLDEFNKTHKINVQLKNNVDEYLNMSMEQIEKLSGDQCGTISVYLSSYSTYLLKVQNRQSAIVRWCESNLNIGVSKEMSQYKAQYQPFEELKLLTIAGNSYLKALDKLRSIAQVRLSEVYGLSKKVDLIIQTLVELSKSRRNHREG